MNIEKCIELLRFYLTEKIDEVNDSLQKTIKDEITNIISSIISLILAIYISTEFITTNGLIWAVLKVIILVVSYLCVYIIVHKVLRLCKTEREIKDSSMSDEISISEAKMKITEFDHVACDGVLLAWDFLRKFNNKKINKHEKEFCLIESFYYFKKALDITKDIVKYCDKCVNNVHVSEGISQYRLINVDDSLNDIYNQIQNALRLLNNPGRIKYDVEKSQDDLKFIMSYVNSIK